MKYALVVIAAGLALSGCASAGLIGQDVQMTYLDGQALDNSPPAVKVKADLAKLLADVKAAVPEKPPT